MKLYSTNNKDLRVSFKDAVFNSLPEDKGLYMPVEIPRLPDSFFEKITKYSLQGMALKVAHALIGEDISENYLKEIIDEAISFDAPLVLLNENSGILELFHGPSFAFKDFGARFMSRVMAYLSDDNDKILDILVATSGDTGGAVALGFLGVKGTRVTILYPKGKVSKIQEQQLTTNGENIRAIEIDGTFDDCQALVKEVFNNPTLNKAFRFTSANSINIARLIPQTFYYFYAYAEALKKGKKDIIFSVPSGNFGDICAGLIAYKMGLPVKHFIAATNINDTVPEFLKTGEYNPKPSKQTYSNAMDVGNPNNWARIMDLFDNDIEKVRKIITAYPITDKETLEGIKELYNDYNYIACPHTSTAFLAAKKYNDKDAFNIFLSTAHPCKFPDIFPENIKKNIRVPSNIKNLSGKPNLIDSLEYNFEDLAKYLENSSFKK